MRPHFSIFLNKKFHKIFYDDIVRKTFCGFKLKKKEEKKLVNFFLIRSIFDRRESNPQSKLSQKFPKSVFAFGAPCSRKPENFSKSSIILIHPR